MPWNRSTRRSFLQLLLALSGLTMGCASSSSEGVAETTGPVRRSALLDAALAPLDFESGRVRVSQASREAWQGSLEAAKTAIREGRRIEAIALLAEAVAASPRQPEAHLELAQLLERRRPKAAEATLRSALELDGESFEAHVELAALLATSGRRRAAVHHYRKALEIREGNGDLEARLAALHHLLGEPALASYHLDRATHLGGRIPQALPSLLAAAPEGQAVPTSRFAAHVGPAVRLDTGSTSQATETAVAGAGSMWVAAWNDQRDGATSAVWRLGAATTLDGGANWSEQVIRPPDAMATDFEGDPFAAYDPRSGESWVGGVTFFQGGSIFVARRQPGGQGFMEPVVASSEPGGFYDKPLMAVGPEPGGQGTRLYITYSDGLIRSEDLGQSWSATLPMVPAEIYYQPRVGPDGVLWIVSWDLDETIWLRRSVDGGVTVEARQPIVTRLDVWPLQGASHVPGEFRVPPLPSLAIGSDGTLFVVYCDTTAMTPSGADLDLYLTSSGDGGATWTAPRVINGDAEVPGDQFAPWLEVDPSGRLHLAYLDTRHHPQHDEDPFGLVDVTYAFSDDDGASWHETRVTEISSSSADGIWVGGPGVPDYQFLGDYLGLGVAASGQAIVVYGAAAGGDFDIFSRRLTPPLFVDGFESESTGAWAAAFGD